MRKTLLPALVILGVIGIFVALGFAFPIYAGFLPLLFMLFLIDGYLFSSLWHWIRNLRTYLKYIVLVIYWLPLLLLICCIITGAFIKFPNWNIPLRTLVPGAIFIIYAHKIIPFIFLLINDILRLFRFGFHSFLDRHTKLSDIPRTLWLQITGWVIGSMFLILMGLGVVWWNYDFNVIRQDIILPELPASFDGLKIVQVSDIHLGSWVLKSELKRAIDLVNEQHPDMIFFTGDMANYTTLDVLPFEEILTHMKAPMGIFAIMGNHDYGAYVSWPSEELKEADQIELVNFYHRLGWKLLLNQHSIVKRGNDSILILGVENWGKAYRFQKKGDIPKAQDGLTGMPVQLLLSHDPSFWDTIICHKFQNIDVTFSGHTHGFQFGIEALGIKWSPAQYLYRQWGGLYAKPVPGSHPQYIYVNRGLGSLGYPGRIGILPEITVFTFRKK